MEVEGWRELALECLLEGSGLSGIEHLSTITSETANNLDTSPRMVCVLSLFRKYATLNISK